MAENLYGHGLVLAILELVCGMGLGQERFIPIGPEGRVPLLEGLRCLGWMCLDYPKARELVRRHRHRIGNAIDPVDTWPLVIQIFLEGSDYFKASVPETSSALDGIIRTQTAAAISNVARHDQVRGPNRRRQQHGTMV